MGLIDAQPPRATGTPPPPLRARPTTDSHATLGSLFPENVLGPLLECEFQKGAKASPLLLERTVQSERRGQAIVVSHGDHQAPLQSLTKPTLAKANPVIAHMSRKPKKKTAHSTKPKSDYQMARSACMLGSYTMCDHTWETADLISNLNKWISAGWSATAIKAYAWVYFRYPSARKVTPANYRDVLSGLPGDLMAPRFLEDYKANPSRYQDIR